MRTLHPLLAAVSHIWERDNSAALEMVSTHGLEVRSSFVGSPMEYMGRTGREFRKVLSEPLTGDDHLVLHELKASGVTDYLGIPMRFSGGAGATLILTTDQPGGFDDSEITNFREIAAHLAPVAEVFWLKRKSLAVAEAYLGARTGDRVLSGEITRGHIGKVRAAILISDIRDWSGLNIRMGAEDAVALANRYFEIIADAVSANGGEILKFIGDGVLAIFPVSEHEPEEGPVCDAALKAAQTAVDAALHAEPALGLRFGVGLHFGEVLYGNIGSRDRIDFTVMGKAVNITARIESRCEGLGKNILFSRGFADRLSTPTVKVAEEVLKGSTSPTVICAAG